MKTIISFVMLLCSIVCANAQENYSLSYIYYSNDDGDFAICDGRSFEDSVDVIVPEYVSYNGFDFKVIGINELAFDEDDDPHYLRSIILPNTIESIGAGAFRKCGKLKFMEIPANVKQIGSCAFQGCREIKEAIIHCSGTFATNIFEYCSGLGYIIYTNPKAPNNWVSTTRTYVPDKEEYSSPYKSLTSTPHIIEMITFSENTFDYTGNVPSVTWTNNVDGYTAVLDMSNLKANAGRHVDTISATFTNKERSFIAKIPYRYTINPVKLAVKVDNASREYGEENPAFSISYSGFISGEDESALTTLPTATTIATKTSNTGEYPITISGGNATNYEFEYEPGVLAVTKAPLSAKVNDLTKVYGSQNPAFTIEYYGLKNEETVPAWVARPAFQTEATQGSSVGQYEVKAVNGVPVNYDMGEITTGTLSITPAPLTIKANDATRQYYGDEPSFSYTCSGFVNGDDESAFSSAPVLSTTATQTSNAGTYEIRVSETSSPNYSISHVNGMLTITPRTLTASVGNYERIYNEDNPAFEVSYSGFVGDENESVLNEKATASTTATKTSDVGSYPIRVSGGDADNYKFSYTSGTLTINKAEQTITWEQDLSVLNVGDQVELQAYATSGLPIHYELSDNNIVSLYSANGKVYLDCLQAGTLVIRALQDGNNNYYAAVRKSKTLNIGDASGIETINVDALYSNAPVYDLMGNRVRLLTKGRIYIQNRKKFIAK